MIDRSAGFESGQGLGRVHEYTSPRCSRPHQIDPCGTEFELERPAVRWGRDYDRHLISSRGVDEIWANRRDQVRIVRVELDDMLATRCFSQPSLHGRPRSLQPPSTDCSPAGGWRPERP